MIIGLVVIVIIAIIGYNYIYKSHRDISEEPSAYTLTASDLAKQFSTEAETYQKKYLNQTITIKGQISNLDATTVTVNGSIFCTMLSSFNADAYKIGQEIAVKGRFIGYDDLLEELKLDQCSITN